MTKNERNPKSECRRQRATGALFGFRASGFFRISSFGLSHCPALSMTNMEFQMTKETRNSKHEGYTLHMPGALRSIELRHSFDIRHSDFVIRHSSLSRAPH